MEINIGIHIAEFTCVGQHTRGAAALQPGPASEPLAFKLPCVERQEQQRGFRKKQGFRNKWGVSQQKAISPKHGTRAANGALRSHRTRASKGVAGGP
eukprot:2323835-Rhodomonas_salina.4